MSDLVLLVCVNEIVSASCICSACKLEHFIRKFSILIELEFLFYIHLVHKLSSNTSIRNMINIALQINIAS